VVYVRGLSKRIDSHRDDGFRGAVDSASHMWGLLVCFFVENQYASSRSFFMGVDRCVSTNVVDSIGVLSLVEPFSFEA
jgi:hypothetical protein